MAQGRQIYRRYSHDRYSEDLGRGSSAERDRKRSLSYDGDRGRSSSSERDRNGRSSPEPGGKLVEKSSSKPGGKGRSRTERREHGRSSSEREGQERSRPERDRYESVSPERDGEFSSDGEIWDNDTDRGERQIKSHRNTILEQRNNEMQYSNFSNCCDGFPTNEASCSSTYGEEGSMSVVGIMRASRKRARDTYHDSERERSRKHMLRSKKRLKRSEHYEPVRRSSSMSGNKKIPSIKVKICPTYTANTADKHRCTDLHICKFFLIGKCKSKEFECKFSHNLRRRHNKNVLKSNKIYNFPDREVLEICRHLDNRNFTTLPFVCKFYNNEETCKKENCQHLHVCKYYVDGDCKFAPKCRRNHSLVRDQQTRKVLETYGIDAKHIGENVIQRVLRDAVKQRRDFDKSLGPSFRPDGHALQQFKHQGQHEPPQQQQQQPLRGTRYFQQQLQQQEHKEPPPTPPPPEQQQQMPLRCRKPCLRYIPLVFPQLSSEL